jgi:hypothetical protein
MVACTMLPTTSFSVREGLKLWCPQSWPTTNNAQNMVPCAIQYSGHTNLKAGGRRQRGGGGGVWTLAGGGPWRRRARFGGGRPWQAQRSVPVRRARAVQREQRGAQNQRHGQGKRAPGVGGIGRGGEAKDDAHVERQVCKGAQRAALEALGRDRGADVRQGERRRGAQVGRAVLRGGGRRRRADGRARARLAVGWAGGSACARRGLWRATAALAAAGRGVPACDEPLPSDVPLAGSPIRGARGRSACPLHGRRAHTPP